MRKIIALSLLCIFSVEVDAQNWNLQRNQFIATNIGINAIAGGTGALLNKRKGQKPLKVFLKGMAQGSLGGSFQVLGKSLTYQITAQENLSYAWAARITNAIGNSITQNAANNINFWERWHFNLGAVRLDYEVKGNKFQARFFPSSLYGIVLVGKQAKLKLKPSLQTGILVFESENNLSFLGLSSIATAQVSSIGIREDLQGSEYYAIMAHETMHILQYDNMVYMNPYFQRLDTNWKNKSKIYNTLSKYIYFDLNGPTLLGAYLSQIKQPWECRHLEREADFFSRWIVWPKCH